MSEKPWSLPEERIVELFADWERKREQGGSGLIELLRATEQEGQKALVAWLKRYEAGVDATGFQHFTITGDGWKRLCAALGVEP
jgi:hypothetical protein